MSALFDFRSFVCVILLSICTCTFVKLKGEARWCGLFSTLLSPAALCRVGQSRRKPCASDPKLGHPLILTPPLAFPPAAAPSVISERHG